MSIAPRRRRRSFENPDTTGVRAAIEIAPGLGVAPRARPSPAPESCTVKTLQAHSVLVQMAINWAQTEGDRARVARLVGHGRELDRRLAQARAAAASEGV